MRLLPWIRKKEVAVEKVSLSELHKRAKNNPYYTDCFLPPENYIVGQKAVEYFGIPVYSFGANSETMKYHLVSNMKRLPFELNKAKCASIGAIFKYMNDDIILIEKTSVGSWIEVLHFTKCSYILI